MPARFTFFHDDYLWSNTNPHYVSVFLLFHRRGRHDRPAWRVVWSLITLVGGKPSSIYGVLGREIARLLVLLTGVACDVLVPTRDYARPYPWRVAGCPNIACRLHVLRCLCTPLLSLLLSFTSVIFLFLSCYYIQARRRGVSFPKWLLARFFFSLRCFYVIVISLWNFYFCNHSCKGGRLSPQYVQIKK